MASDTAGAFPGPNAALFGYTGFVGTTLRRSLSFAHHFNSKNVDDARGASFDTVVFAAMPAVKWLANKEPERDLATTRALQEVLGSISVGRRFVLISTIDIYQPADSQADEDAAAGALQNATLHAYGKHRALMEQFVRDTFGDKATIIRLPALFGLHLRKNYVYDMLVGNNTSAINRNSAFQWYDLARLAGDISRVLDLGLREVNLFPEPLPTEALIDMVAQAGVLHGGGDGSAVGQAGAFAGYNLCTKYGEQLGGPARYSSSAAQVSDGFRAFLTEYAMMQRTTVSCIAWDEANNDAALELLRLQGVRYIELAPPRFWEWADLEAAHAAGDLAGAVAGFAATVRGAGMLVSSLQAILFKKPELALFGPPEVRAAFVAHMKLVVDLAAALAAAGVTRPGVATPIVFGAPKNRQVPDGMSQADADAVFVEVFRELGAYAAERGCVICIEPNATGYACNFITNSTEGLAAVRAVGSPGVALHLDTGCMTMAGEDLAAGFKAAAGHIGHVHVSEPFLAPYTAPKANHAAAAAALRDIGYDKLVSLELLTKGLDELRASLAFYQATYLPAFERGAAGSGDGTAAA